MNVIWIKLLCVLLVAVQATIAGKNVPESESVLRKAIFSDYDKLVRPVRSAATPVNFSIAISPLVVSELNYRDQILVLQSWIQMNWHDEYLKWDKDVYGISDLRIPSSEVWKPDLSLYSVSHESFMFPTSPTNVIVYSNGDVLWVPFFTINSRCPIAIGAKKVECKINFGSWTFGENLLNLQLFKEGLDMTNFSDQNVDWKLENAVVERIAKKYPCCEELYPSVYLNVTLRRRENNNIFI